MSDLNAHELIDLTLYRIRNLKKIEHREFLEALSSDSKMEQALIDTARNGTDQDYGALMKMWMHIYFEADIKGHGGL